MSKIVKVTYNADTLQTTITVDGKVFDTSRIDGKEIADWAYPFMMRKIRWNGFYDEMVSALGGEKAFDLVFDGTEEALVELKEAWEDAPVNIVGENNGNSVEISYDENSLSVSVKVNGKAFDTSRIDGKEIEDWVYPFMMRKVKWDGIFEELAKAVGSDEYDIVFSGARNAMKVLMEECPETVALKFNNSNTLKAESPVSAKAHEARETGSDNKEATELYQKGMSLLENKSFKKAIKFIRESAELGYAPAQYQLGICYKSEIGVKRNDAEMAKWFGKATEQGLASAQHQLGECYNTGKGVVENTQEAHKLFRKSAEQGYTEAMLAMGWVSRDVKDAEMWFEKVLKVSEDSEIREEAEEGLAELRSDPKSWSKRGEENQKNKTIINSDNWMANGDRYFEALNYDEAVRCYRKAEKQGIIDAKAKLGFCYLCGLGVSQNNEYGAQLLEEAIEEGSEIAQDMIEVYNKEFGEVYRSSMELSPVTNNCYNNENNSFKEKILQFANYIQSDEGKEVVGEIAKGLVKGAKIGAKAGIAVGEGVATGNIGMVIGGFGTAVKEFNEEFSE